MTVARITMVEYVSKEAADDFEPRYSEVAPKSSSSAAYEGQWRNGEKDGFGSEFDEIGEGYIGQFKNGSYHGKGTDTILPIVFHFATI